MKGFLCVLLAALLSFSFTNCTLFGRSCQNGVPDQTEADTPAPTEAAVPTAVPGDKDASEALARLDMDLFRELVTTSGDSYNQLIAGDPGRFGIDPDDVERGWGSIGYDAHVSSMAFSRRVLGLLSDIDRDALAFPERAAYDSLKRTFEVQLQYEDYYYYDEPLTPLNGYHTTLPLGMVCFNVRELADVEAYLCLIEDMPRLLGEIAEFEEGKAEHGLFMCEKALDQVTASCRAFAEKGEDCFLIPYFETVLEKAMALGASGSQCEGFRQRNRDLVLNGLLPAYERLADTLEAHRADCTAFVGASERSAEAKAYFELKARDEGATMDDMDTVLELVENMGNAVFSDLCFALVYGGDDITEKYSAGEEIGFGSIEENLEWLKGFAEEYYPPMPEYSLKYIDVPEDIADDFSPAAYLIPAFDDFHDNLMLINRADEGSDDLLTIAHESIPGHMYQYLNTRNNGGFSLSQQVLEPTGYAEGWTVFTEDFTAKHCSEIGREYCTAVCSESIFFNVFVPAYVSIRVNREGWSFEDVEEFLSEYGAEDAADIFYEYAVTMPFYSMSYAIGYSYFYDIFRTADPSEPEECRAFFERYLSFGPTWMDLMREYMGS
ncbi:MAG: DUF885 family protein [Clostridia bacterium]|nr:DUF885 family protein [Clostridia bacterium]